MTSLREVFAAHPGTNEVHLTVVMADKEVAMKSDQIRVAPSPSLFADLKALLGPGCLESPMARNS